MDRHALLVLHMTHDPMQELFQSSETRVSHELYLASIAFSILKELEGLGMDDSLLPLGHMQLRVVLKQAARGCWVAAHCRSHQGIHKEVTRKPNWQ